MIKITSLKVEKLKDLCREHGLATTGSKSELIQRLIESLGRDEVAMEENASGSIEQQISELRQMIAGMATAIQTISHQSTGGAVQCADNINNNSSSSMRSESSIPISRNNYSVKEIAETIPEYDPTSEVSLSAEQFVVRVESVKSAYLFDDKCLLLAVYSRMKGAAKLWLDAAQTLATTWAEFSQSLINEFGRAYDEADVHFKMAAATRRQGERICDYTFRMSALGHRYSLTENAVIKYTREGLRHRELQAAIAPIRFKSVKEIRETCEEYLGNIPTSSVNRNIKSDQQRNELKSDNRGFKPDSAKFKNITCYNCNEKGHFSNECTKPQRRKRCESCQKVHGKNEPENCGKANAIVRKIEKSDISNDLFGKSVRLGDITVTAFFDTGSQCSMVRRSTANILSGKREPCSMKIKGICGGTRLANEKLFTKVELDNSVSVNIEFYIVDDEFLTTDVLIGQEIFENKNIYATITKREIIFKDCQNKITTRNSSKQYLNKDDIFCEADDDKTNGELIYLLNNYRDVFASNLGEIGKTDLIEMEIKIDRKEPVVQQPYRIPEPKKAVVAEMIKELMDNDIITKSSSEYASPITMVKKQDGSDRLCIDYRRLNQHTPKEIFPMANIEECLQNAKQFKYFTVLDLNSGYYQIPVEQSSRKFTAFITTEGLYEFKRMPFGLKNAPAVFQRLMAKLKEKTQQHDMQHYMDDILVGSNTIPEMFDKLGRIFEALRESKLTLNVKKCKFLTRKIEFLGHQLSPEGISPGFRKTAAIQEFKRPKNVTEVRQFLGLSGYFRKFVPGYAIISEPMRQLLRKNQQFVWGDDQQKSFEKLKLLLVTQPVMTAYCVDAAHEIHTDASSIGLAGVLLQQEEDDWKPIMFYSRSTSDIEKSYHSYELETLAVVESLERFRYYIYGKEVTVVTDCSAIKTTMEKRELIPRIARWWLRVQDYSVHIEHRSGRRMEHVDALSRAPTEDPRDAETASMRIAKASLEQDDWLFSMQLQDEKIKEIVKKIHAKDKEVNPEYIIDHGRLYRKIGNEKAWVVPKALRWRIVQDSHDKAGHLGVEKTIDRMKQTFWFPRMRNYTKSYIKSCVDCAFYKHQGGKKEAEYHYDLIEPIPFKTIHMDHLGPFPKSSKGNEYVFLIIDPFTKYTILRAVKSTATKYVIAVLNEVSSFFGLPTRIVTDRGTAFTSKDFKNHCKDSDIKHVQNAVRTPRANGHAERANRTLLSMLLPTTKSDKRWDEHLRNIQWAMNTMRNKTTQRTPNELLYGFEPKDILQNKILSTLQNDDPALEQDLQLERETAACRIDAQREKAKQRYDDAHAKPKIYNEGDLVLIENEPSSTGTSRKLEPRYKGPFIITKKLDKDRYVIGDVPGTHRKQRHYSSVHASDKFKPWCTFLTKKNQETKPTKIIRVHQCEGASINQDWPIKSSKL